MIETIMSYIKFVYYNLLILIFTADIAIRERFLSYQVALMGVFLFVIIYHIKRRFLIYPLNRISLNKFVFLTCILTGILMYFKLLSFAVIGTGVIYAGSLNIIIYLILIFVTEKYPKYLLKLAKLKIVSVRVTETDEEGNQNVQMYKVQPNGDLINYNKKEKNIKKEEINEETMELEYLFR